MCFNVSEKNRKKVFFAVMIVAYLAIFVFNCLTPYMSDDLYYKPGLPKPISQLIAEEYENYMLWNGRTVLQFLMRCFLAMPKWVFNVVNSGMYTAFTLLVYVNVENKKKYDAVLFSLINIFVWLWGVSFAETVLWLSGACNYLWGMVIMLGFVTLFRKMLKSDYFSFTRMKKILITVGMLLYGVISGWCNENTSGGIFLLIVGFMLIDRSDRRNAGEKVKLLPWQIASGIGVLLGILAMVLSPGNDLRNILRTDEEAHTGGMAYLARLLKLNTQVLNTYSVVFSLIVIFTLYLLLKRFDLMKLRGVLVLVVSAIITSYVLIIIATPMDRAHFGSWSFLLIACMQLIVYLPTSDVYLQIARYASVILLSCFLFFDYCEGGADLMRIVRELDERQVYVDSQVEQGNLDLTLPMVRTEFDTRFSFFFQNDISNELEDAFGNKIYKHYYDLDSIKAVPREEWTEY